MEVRGVVMRLGAGGTSIFPDRDSVEVAEFRHRWPSVREQDLKSVSRAWDETLRRGTISRVPAQKSQSCDTSARTASHFAAGAPHPPERSFNPTNCGPPE